MRSVVNKALYSNRLIVAAIAAAWLAVEAYVVLGDADGRFSIRGRDTYEIGEFSDGAVVSQAFLMRGNGLNNVRVQLSSDRAGDATLGWRLWSGFRDQPQSFAVAFEGEQPVELRPGPQWVSFEFPRNGSSNDQWFTIEFWRKPQADAPRLTVTASHDNPQRGGALWLNDEHKTGSLVFSAGWSGRTPYRRFMLEAAPHLPIIFRREPVQWLIVVAIHWAAVVFVMAALKDAARAKLPS